MLQRAGILLFLLLALPSALADTCEIVNASKTLTSDINATGTCFTINADNVVLDGAGYTVTGDGSGTGVLLSPTSNLTVRNFGNISQFSRAVDTGSSSNVSIYNNTLQANASFQPAVYLGGGDNISVVGNTITASGQAYGVSLPGGRDVRVLQNRIDLANTSSSAAVYVSGVLSFEVADNNISTDGSGTHGLVVWGASHGIVRDNIIETFKAGSHAVNLTRSGDIQNLSFSNNVLRTHASGSYPLILRGVVNSTFSGDTLNGTGYSLAVDTETTASTGNRFDGIIFGEGIPAADFTSHDLSDVVVALNRYPPVDPAGKRNLSIFFNVSSTSGTNPYIDFNSSYTNANITGLLPESIRFHYYNFGLGLWVVLATSTVDVAGNRVRSGNFTPSGTYGVFGVINESVPPAWSNPANFTTAYGPQNVTSFNITWTDNGTVEVVLIEVNYTSPLNHTASSLGSGLYNLTLAGLPAGTHQWRSHANDSVGNRNTTQWFTFTIPQAAPTLNLTLNGTAGNVTIEANTSIWLNGSVVAGDTSSTTLSLYINGTFILSSSPTIAYLSNLSDFASYGAYNITLMYAQTANYSNYNITWIVNVVDRRAPGWSNPRNVTPATFNATAQLRFNITWSDDVNVSTVLIEVNRSGASQNYTAYSLFGAYNLTLADFPAGTHSWRSFASDSSGNWNRTSSFPFIIAQTNPILNLTLNGTAGNVTIEEDVSIKLNGTILTGDGVGGNNNNLVLTRDGVVLSLGNNIDGSVANLTLFADPGTFNITLYYNSTQNYTANSTTYFVTVSDTTPPAWSAVMNSTPAVYSPSGGVLFNLTWADNGGVSHVMIEVNQSGTAVNYSVPNSTADGTYNMTLFGLAAGTHRWRSHANDTTNYQNSTGWYPFSMAKATPSLNLTLNGTNLNLTGGSSIGEYDAIWLNGTVLTGDPISLELYKNGTLIANSSTLANFTNFTAAGLYNLTLTYRGSQNYTNSRVTYWVQVNDTLPPMVQSHSPTGTITSSSTTLTADTNEYAECRYSTSSGTSYESMGSTMAGNTTSHSVSLSSLTTGTYHYYIRCNSTGGQVSTTDYDATFAVSIQQQSGGGGGGGIYLISQTGEQTEVSPEELEALLEGSYTVPVDDTGLASILVERDDLTVMKLEFHVDVPLESVEVEISVHDAFPASPGVPRPEEPAPNGTTVVKYLSITVTNVSDTSDATISFKLTHDELGSGAAEDVQLHRYTNGSWEGLDTRVTQETGTEVWYEAQSGGFSVFAIAMRAPQAIAEPTPTGEVTAPPVTGPIGEGEAVQPGRGVMVIPSFIRDILPLFMTFVVISFIGVIGLVYFGYVRQQLIVKKVQDRKAQSIYAMPEVQTLPQSKFAYIGLIADTDVQTHLDHTQLNQHALIAGGTGSGKTVAGMVIVEELAQKGIPVVVFDPLGQWSGFVKRNDDAAMLGKYQRFSLSGPRAFDAEVIDASLVPGVNLIHYLQKGLTVLKLDKLSPGEMDEFIDEHLEQVYRANLEESGSLRALVVLDEVHRLLPRYGGKIAYLKLEQAVREFRKWGIGVLMMSQVHTDFKGAIRGNIGTLIQMRTRYEGDIHRVRERHGPKFSRLVPKLGTGIGMVECADYNKGQPYFVEFRPLLHSPRRLPQKELAKVVQRAKPVLSTEAKYLVSHVEQMRKSGRSEKDIRAELRRIHVTPAKMRRLLR